MNSVISRHQNTILTYEELDQRSNALARGLAKRGVRKGDACAVMLGNNVEFATVCIRTSKKPEHLGLVSLTFMLDYICVIQTRRCSGMFSQIQTSLCSERDFDMRVIGPAEPSIQQFTSHCSTLALEC